MTVRTRKPTGLPAWPLILVEGEEKAGKTFLSLALSASEKVGRTFAFDLGDGTADEYAELGPYEVVDLNGTYSDLRAQVDAVCDEPRVDPDRPNVVVIDSGTQMWDSLKAWADTRARSSRKAQEALKKDPDAEIDTSMNYWNDSKDRWAGIVGRLRRWDGIAIITAQGGEVAEVQNGRPTGRSVWSVQAEKTLPANVTAWVRVKRDPRSATLVAVRRLNVDVPRNGLSLPMENTLEHLVFDVIGAGGFGAVNAKGQVVGIPIAQAKGRVLDAVRLAYPDLEEAEAKKAAGEAWASSGLSGDEIAPEPLADLLATIATEAPDA